MKKPLKEKRYRKSLAELEEEVEQIEEEIEQIGKEIEQIAEAWGVGLPSKEEADL